MSVPAREPGFIASLGNLSWTTGFGPLLKCKAMSLEEGGLLQNAAASGYHRDQDGFGDRTLLGSKKC